MKTYGFEIEFTGENYEISQESVDGERLTIVISPEEAGLLMDYIDVETIKAGVRNGE